MPIYEYECPNCGTFEQIQTSSEKPLKECPTCKEKGKKTKVTRLMSTGAFHLKGTGWYVTDFKDKPKEAVSTKKENSSETSKKDSVVSDSTGSTPTATTENKKEKTKKDKISAT